MATAQSFEEEKKKKIAMGVYSNEFETCHHLYLLNRRNFM